MKLKEIAKVQGGFAFKSDSFVSNETPIIRIGNIINNEIVIDKDITAPISTIGEKKEFLIFKDDLLIAMSGATVGKVGIYNFDSPSMLNQRVGNIKSDEMYKKYIFYLLQSPKFKKYVELSSMGCAQPNISNSQIENFEFKENNIDQIEKMVRKLDSVNSLINIKKSEIEKCKELVKSQFVEMFNDKTFEAIELNELCDVRDGTHDSPKYLDSSDYKFITSKNIVGDSIDFSDCKYIKEDDYNKFNQRSKVNTGDILMPMIGTIGNPIIVNIPEDEINFAIKNVALIKFNSNSKVTNVYIKSLLNSDFFENVISQNKRGGTQKFIALSDIRKIKVPVPPIELQNKFAKIVDQIDKQKFEFEKSLKKLEELQASLMQEYFG